MKVAIFALCIAFAIAQPPPPTGPPHVCPSGVNKDNCDKFFQCMATQPKPPPPPPQAASGTNQGPPPTQPPGMAQSETYCFGQAGMSSIEQAIMQANRPNPPQGPPPQGPPPQGSPPTNGK